MATINSSETGKPCKSPRLLVTADDCPPLPVIDGVEIRHCPGLVGYAITEDGVVWGCRRRRGWNKIAGSTTTDGYRQVLTCINNERRSARVHVLILQAFVGPRPDGMVARHLDGNKKNNSRANLAWGTPSENTQDAIRHGTHAGLRLKGEINPCAKLTDYDARHIFLMKGKKSQRKIASEFGVSQYAVWAIHNRTRWLHVSVDTGDSKSMP